MSQPPSTKPHAFNPLTVPLPPPSYSQLCITPLLPSSRLITLAGMTGISHVPSPTTPNPTDLPAQAKIAYSKILASLAAAGATPRDIVQVKHYIVVDKGDGVDVVDRGWAGLWCEFMDREGEGHRPPDTVVGVVALAERGILYECEVWAVVGE